MKTQLKNNQIGGFSYRLTSTLSFILGLLLMFLAEVSSSQQLYWGPDTNFVSEPMEYGEAMDYVFENIQPFMNTDILIDRTMGAYTKRNLFQGEDFNETCYWGDFYAILSKLSSSRIPYTEDNGLRSTHKKAMEYHENRQTIPFGIVDYSYEEINDYAKTDKVLRWVNNKLIVEDPTFPILIQKRTFAASPLLPFVTEREFQLSFDSTFFIRNNEVPVLGLTLQAGINSEPINVSIGDIVSLNCYESDSLELFLTLNYEDGVALSCKSILFFFPEDYQGQSEDLREKKNGQTNTIFTFAPLTEQAGYTETISVNSPIGGAQIQAQIGIYYGCGNGRKQLRKPFIVCTGYGPFGGSQINNSKKDAYAIINGLLGKDGAHAMGANYTAEMNNGSNLLYRLRNEGFDVVIVDPNIGVDHIQNYAALIIEAIHRVNALKARTGSMHENVIQGISMGAIAVRYALAVMEDRHYQNPTRNPHHHCRAFISYEGEMQGATIPLGIQATAHHIMRNSIESVAYFLLDDVSKALVNQIPWYLAIIFPKAYIAIHATSYTLVKTLGTSGIVLYFDEIYEQLFNNPAAKSLLIHHYDGNNTPGDLILHSHPLHQTLFFELDSIGYPQDCRLIAIANASNNGTQPSAPFGDVLVNITDDDGEGNLVSIKANLEEASGVSKLFEYSYKFKGITVSQGTIRKIHPLRTSFSSGSYEGFYAHYILPLAVLKSRSLNDYNAGYRAPFVPIESAFDIQVNRVDLNFNALDSLLFTAPGQRDPDREKGYPHNSPHYADAKLITPFDALFASEATEFHVGNISERIVDFILSEVAPSEMKVQNRSIPGVSKYFGKLESRNNLSAGFEISNEHQSGDFQIDSLKTYLFIAESEIALNSGFHAKNGSTYSAVLDAMNEACYSFVRLRPKRFIRNDEDNSSYKNAFSGEYPTAETCERLSPNPCVSYTRISSCDKHIHTIRIFNTQGVLIQELPFSGSKLEINTSHLPSGLYLVKLVSEENEITTKLVKQ